MYPLAEVMPKKDAGRTVVQFNWQIGDTGNCAGRTIANDKEGNQFTVRIGRILAANEAVSSRVQAVSSEQRILDFCVEPRSLTEICELLGLKDRYKVKKKYINPLLGKTLRMTEPNSPNSPTQKYVRNS